MRIVTNGIVTNEYDEILLIRRNDTRTWAPPGGGVERDELPPENVAREVREESGLIVLPVRLVGVSFWDTRPNGILTFTFRCIQRGGDLTTSKESPQVGFFPAASLPRPMIPFHHQRIIGALRHSGGPPDLSVQHTSWRMGIARFVLFNLVYRGYDLMRLLRRQALYRPPPDYQVSAHLLVRDPEGRLLWVRPGPDGPWGLPGALAAPKEPPWQAVSRMTLAQIGRAFTPLSLAAVHSAGNADHLHFLFTANVAAGWQPEDRIPLETSFVPRGQEPPGRVGELARHMVNASGEADVTVFQRQGDRIGRL